MLPGKTYKPEDVLQILRRRIWWVLVPFAIVSAVTAAVARKLPNQYRSEAVIQVVPQRVPEDFVRSTVTTRIEDRLQATQQQILSRTKLERIIQEFDLYKDERESQIMQDIVDRMRTRDIKVQIVRGDIFTVSYVAPDARRAMQVTERLASLFVDESTRDRAIQADGTNQFLEAQLKEALAKLQDHEVRLKDYRMKHSGDLPSQYDANQQALLNLQQQIQALVSQLGNDEMRRLALDRQIEDLEAEIAAPAAVPVPVIDPDAPGRQTTAQRLAAARVALASAEARLKPDHPDIAVYRRQVRDLERIAEAEAQTSPLAGGANPAEQQRHKRLAGLREERALLVRQIDANRDEEKRLRGIAGGYQQRLERLPIRETELVDLTRDYDIHKANYESLLRRQQEAQLSANMENRAIGEQFRPIDPARLPERPDSPNRPLINGIGLGAGLAIGLLLVAFLEYRDSSFKTDDEVSSVLRLPVLAVVPVMQSSTDVSRARRRRLLRGMSLGATVSGCLAVVVYTFLF